MNTIKVIIANSVNEILEQEDLHTKFNRGLRNACQHIPDDKEYLIKALTANRLRRARKSDLFK